MKKKQDFLSLIRTIKPKTASDEVRITEYCHNIGENVNFKDLSQLSISVSFDEFIFWIDSGFPEVGDVVAYDQYYTLGIISSIDDEHIHLGVSILNQDGFVISDIKRPKTGFRYATEDEILKIHKALAKKGFTWNIWRNCLAKRTIIPRPYMLIKFRSYINDDCGVGVFREINQDGELVMYCAVENKGEARYSLYETIGPAQMYQLAQGNRSDINKLKTALKKVDRTWNFLYDRIEPLNFNIDYGETYYYINEGGKILKAKRDASAAYRKRLAFGNHFIHIEQAEAAKANILEIRNLQLALDEYPDNLPSRPKSSDTKAGIASIHRTNSKT